MVKRETVGAVLGPTAFGPAVLGILYVIEF
jgi:hypothetical protein